MSYPSYPEYIGVAVSWLGEIPAHWKVISLRRAVKKISNGLTATQVDEGTETIPVTRIETISHGFIDFGKVGHVPCEEADGRFLLQHGDILLSHINSLPMVGNVAINLSDHDLLHGMNLLRIQCDRKECAPLYLFYWLKSKNLRQEIESRAKPAINQASLPVDEIKKLPCLVPPLKEQTKIARFLDHQTARIDALIAEQQRLMELLKEKRQAVISHAVTKGLDPDVAMKGSGVEWLGEVPEHWTITRLKHYADLITGYPFSSSGFSEDEGDVKLLRGANVGIQTLKWDDTVYWHLPEGDPLNQFLMREDQIVIGMDRPWIGDGLRIARVKERDLPCLLVQRVAAIDRTAEELNTEFLYHLLSGDLLKAYIEPELTGVSVPHISPDQIMEFEIPLPPLEEQVAIANHVSEEFQQLDSLLIQADRSSVLLQERRSALISAAVTGEIDVRDWQPQSSESFSDAFVGEGATA